MPAKRSTAAATTQRTQQQRPPPPPQPPTPSSSSSSEDGGDGGEGTIASCFFDTHYSDKFLAQLPATIRTRARVLLHYHDEYMKLQAEAERAETALRRTYEQTLYAPLLQRRRDIVAGAAVSDAEVERGFPAEHAGKVRLSDEAGDADTAPEAATQKPSGASGGVDGDDKNDNDNNNEGKHDDAAAAAPTTTTAHGESGGLPEFWLRVLQHHVMFEHLIQPHDLPVLRCLSDITSHTSDGEYGGFAVVFTFAPNAYLSNHELRLEVRIVDGSTTIVRTPPVWRPGKNVTVRSVAQKQRSRRTGQTRTITREVPQPSFFTIFDEKDDDDDDDDDDAKAGGGRKSAGAQKTAKKQQHKSGAMQRRGGDDDDDENDDDDDDDEDEDDRTERLVQMLQLLHTSIIPAAVEYYTGEAQDGSSDMDDDDEEYDDDDDEDDDDEDEE